MSKSYLYDLIWYVAQCETIEPLVALEDVGQNSSVQLVGNLSKKSFWFWREKRDGIFFIQPHWPRLSIYHYRRHAHLWPHKGCQSGSSGTRFCQCVVNSGWRSWGRWGTRSSAYAWLWVAASNFEIASPRRWFAAELMALSGWSRRRLGKTMWCYLCHSIL